MSFFEYTFGGPLGNIVCIADDSALYLLEFEDSEELLQKKKRILQETTPINKKNTIISSVLSQVSEYFEGTRQDFDIPLSPIGTDFQIQAWKALTTIPFGETRSYQEEATIIGNPKAVRAIGGANHNNPIVIIIPCHRVIGKNNTLTGYGGGIERKKWLLDHEKAIKTSDKRSSIS